MKEASPKIEEYPVGSILGQEELDAIKRVIESGQPLTRGPEVELFEKEFAEYCNVKHAVAVSSCGAALHIAMQILNLTDKDEVICQGNSFWAAYAPLLERNVTIKVADVDPDSLNIDADKIESLITEKTKAIYITHHGGNPADIVPIREIAHRHGIVVIEDAAHALGAEYKGKKIGSDSDIACFSFSTLKNITTLGEGGMIVSNRREWHEIAQGLRTNFPYGERIKRQASNLGDYPKPKSVAFMHPGDAWDYEWKSIMEVGKTYRMSTPQAAVGRVQLKKLDRFNSIRENIANRYNDAIDNIKGLRKVKILPGCKHAWHLFTFFLDYGGEINRNDLVKYIEEKYNIHIVIRFWPMHLGGIMRMRGHGMGECPNLERAWFNEQLSLPISPQMREWEIKRVIDALTETMEDFRNR
ncbi:DegT/DnrJ/EryC1/StrS family aminotransferase [Candidatus Woesearchaeota archaeon]|nr:DegT/DnrJ/EryC1/StrS family aminotransferase [Candidatus Woesearchaeota archaeon]